MTERNLESHQQRVAECGQSFAQVWQSDAFKLCYCVDEPLRKTLTKLAAKSVLAAEDWKLLERVFQMFEAAMDEIIPKYSQIAFGYGLVRAPFKNSKMERIFTAAESLKALQDAQAELEKVRRTLETPVLKCSFCQ